jgi:hypothetical protein
MTESTLLKSRKRQRQLPWLYYGNDKLEDLFCRERIEADAETALRILKRYADCRLGDGTPGKFARSSETEFFKLRDGRLIDYLDIADVIWDSAIRQRERVKEYLQSPRSGSK